MQAIQSSALAQKVKSQSKPIKPDQDTPATYQHRKPTMQGTVGQGSRADQLLLAFLRGANTTSDLRSLHSRNLLHPACGGMVAADGAQLVGGIAWDADVVVALEDELEVAELEVGGAAELGDFAGGGDDLVDEGVGEVEEDLFGCWLVGRGREEVSGGEAYFFGVRGEAVASAGDLHDKLA